MITSRVRKAAERSGVSGTTASMLARMELPDSVADVAISSSVSEVFIGSRKQRVKSRSVCGR